MLICVCQVASLLREMQKRIHAGIHECPRAHCISHEPAVLHALSQLSEQPSPFGFPFFWSLTLWALHPLVHPLPRSSNKSISRSQTPSLFVSRLRVSELQLCLHCCRLLEPRLVRGSGPPSSEALVLAQTELPRSLRVPLAEGSRLPLTDSAVFVCAHVC